MIPRHADEVTEAQKQSYLLKLRKLERDKTQGLGLRSYLVPEEGLLRSLALPVPALTTMGRCRILRVGF